MSLIEENRIERAGSAGAEVPAWDPRYPDLTLGETAAADLLLGLAGVLPAGHVLGHAVSGGSASPGTVGVELPSPDAGVEALVAGGVVLRDEEHTPLAALEGLWRVTGSPRVVMGALRPLRRRESGISSRLRVDFDDPARRHRPLLLLERPAMREDVEELATWAGRLAGPVVLVPEHSEGRDRLPTGRLVQLASALLADIGARNAAVYTVPLEPRDSLSDAALVAHIAGRLEATEVRCLDESGPQASAAHWATVRSLLVEGRDRGPLPGVSPRTETLLRGWLPPRSTRGLAIMFTGLSGSGKSTLARDVGEWITEETTRRVTLLDGDRVRQMLSSGLGFDPASRDLNVRRIGYVAAEIVRHGGIALCSPIAPSAATRAEVRRMVERAGDFVLVHVATPIEECERRDLKGLYAQARAGRIPDFTGVSAPYDLPTDAELRIDTTGLGRADAARLVIDYLVAGGWTQQEAM